MDKAWLAAQSEKSYLKVAGWIQRVRDAVSGNRSPLLTWCLDYPSPDHAPRFTHSGRVVQGWVLLDPEKADTLSRVRIICHLQPAFELCCPLELKRLDVIERILQQPADGHEQLSCGFRFTVPPDLHSFNLSFELDGQRWPLQRIEVEPAVAENTLLKVIKGHNDWLFLDNDTNFSIDQFTGRLQLTTRGLKSWEAYVDALKNGFGAQRSPAVMLVAPTKESVMGHYHPMTAAAVSPLDPVFALFPPGLLLHPVSELRDTLGDEAFFKTDTHWTHRGGSLAAALVARKLGLSAEHLDRLLASDRYRVRNHAGDLGSKLEPRMAAPASFLTSFHYGKWVVYDNGLPNFGRVIVIQYPDALEEGCCLVFGSSSSYSMFNYLSRFFRQLVFVHTAGNLDPSLIDAVAPDYLIVQTNARFMIRPPIADYNLKNTIIEKQDSLDCTAIERQAQIRKVSDLELVTSLGLEPWHVPVSAIDHEAAV
ncbi:alginate O-acetyltransferase AlgX-related protein [Marinobacterium sp. YM272]|uniref:alginate O-acetyltransferase AlgX-related protein n=1 Tax=Marinobacterium sp. YM272 TaxID=3421654 RepID=UPI003D7FE965